MGAGRSSLSFCLQDLHALIRLLGLLMFSHPAIDLCQQPKNIRVVWLGFGKRLKLLNRSGKAALREPICASTLFGCNSNAASN